MMASVSELDTQIIALEKQLILLRRRRNALTPLGQLPAETLTHIFDLIQYNSDGAERTEFNNLLWSVFSPATDALWTSGSDHSWVRFMSSCTRTRTIALESPRLWHREGIKIPGNEAWRCLCIERSFLRRRTQRPIVFAHAPSNTTSSEIVHYSQLLMTYLRQASAAFVSMKHYTAWEFANDLRAFLAYYAFQHLEYLSLSSSGTTELTRVFMRGRYPILTTLVLSGIGNIDKWPNLQSLRRLMLSYDMYNCQNGIQVNSLLQWLDGSATLEVLSIEHSGTMTHAGSPHAESDHPSITLPSLCVLRLVSGIRGLRDMIDMLPQPKAGLDIHAQDCYTMNEFLTLSFVRHFYEDLISYTRAFWLTHAGDQSTKKLITSLMYFSHHNRPQTLISLSSLEPREYRGLDLNGTFCRLVGPQFGSQTSLYVDVQYLHLAGSYFSTAIESDQSDIPDPMQDLCNFDFRTVFVENFDQYAEIVLLGKWLRQRYDDGEAIRLLRIRKSPVRIETKYLQDMIAELSSLNMIGTVEWV